MGEVENTDKNRWCFDSGFLYLTSERVGVPQKVSTLNQQEGDDILMKNNDIFEREVLGQRHLIFKITKAMEHQNQKMEKILSYASGNRV